MLAFVFLLGNIYATYLTAHVLFYPDIVKHAAIERRISLHLFVKVRLALHHIAN